MGSSLQLRLRLSLAFFVSCFVPIWASSFQRAGLVTEEDATQSLETELAGGIRPDAQRHLQWFEETLRSTYLALPKNAAGNLGHHAVRYVLHRLFVHQRGWFIRGLEPTNDTSWRTANKPLTVKEWVPDFLQGILEKKEGERGADTRELAALAAAVEDLVSKEATGRLQTAYELHGLPLSGPSPEEQVHESISTYFVAYLKAVNFSAVDADELSQKKQLFAKQYAGYDEAKAWLDGVVDKRLGKSRSDSLDFVAASNIAKDIGEPFYAFNDLEGKSLKATLQGLEGKKAGRVRLSTFFKASFYSHWRFNEKADYPKRLGALDDSDPQQPRVIVPNIQKTSLTTAAAATATALNHIPDANHSRRSAVIEDVRGGVGVDEKLARGGAVAIGDETIINMNNGSIVSTIRGYVLVGMRKCIENARERANNLMDF